MRLTIFHFNVILMLLMTKNKNSYYFFNSVKNKRIWLITLKSRGYFFPFKNFSLIWRRYHYRWITSNFDRFSELMAIRQWGFVPLLQCLWSSVYNCHLRVHYLLTSAPACEANVLPLKHHGGFMRFNIVIIF